MDKLFFRVTLKTLHLVLFNSRLILLELSWKFDRSFCRADASEIELMVTCLKPDIIYSDGNFDILVEATNLAQYSSCNTIAPAEM